MKNFEGTLIIVSHDRDFLQGLTSRVYEFRDHKIREYLGDLDYYLDQRKMQDMRAVEKSDKGRKNKQDKTKNKQTSFEDQKEAKRLKNQLSKVEAKITKLEKDIKSKDKELAQNYEKTITRTDFLNKYNESKKKLENLMKEWEEIQFSLEEIN